MKGDKQLSITVSPCSKNWLSSRSDFSLCSIQQNRYAHGIKKSKKNLWGQMEKLKRQFFQMLSAKHFDYYMRNIFKFWINYLRLRLDITGSDIFSYFK